MADEAENPTPEMVACPHCGSPVEPTAVLCTQCGYNLQTGTVVSTQILEAPPPRRSRTPALGSASAQRPGSTFGGNQWSVGGILGAVIVAVIIVALKSIHFGGAAQTIADSNVSLVKGQFYSQEIRSSRGGSLRGTFTCSSGAPYAVYVLSSSDAISLRVGRDPNTLGSKFSTSGTGSLAMPPVELGAGSWSVVIVNLGDTTINVQYKIEGVR
jgi:hypothetical protein